MNYGPLRVFMPDSPLGNEIVRIEGDAETLGARARGISALGAQMEQAALTLERLTNDQVGEGASLDALKDQAGEVHADVRTAGARYAGSGEVLERYARALATAQRVLDPIVQDCIDQWEIVQSRASAADSADNEVVDGDRPGVEAAEGRLGAAESDWMAIAQRYDAPFESWETAYEAALTGLEQVNEDGVSDGFWDDVLPAIDMLVFVLEWVGIALVIAALVVGGPIIAILAAVVAVIALVGTIILFAKGRRGGVDLALAIVGVLPFGKLASFGKATSDAVRASATFPRLTGALNIARGADDVTRVKALFTSLDEMASNAWVRNAPDALRPYNQLTAGSRFLQRLSVLPEFHHLNPVTLNLSREAVAARYLDVDVPLGSLTLVEAQVARFGAHANNLLSPLSTVVDTVDRIETSHDIDSWRG